MSDTVNAGLLRALIERIESVEEDIRDLNADKSEIYKEARGHGYDVKAIRRCVAARKLDTAEREERDAMFDLYWSALNGSSRVHVYEEQPETAQQSTTNEGESDAKYDLHRSYEKSDLIYRRRPGMPGAEEGQTSINYNETPTESAAGQISAPSSQSAASAEPEDVTRPQAPASGTLPKREYSEDEIPDFLKQSGRAA